MSSNKVKFGICYSGRLEGNDPLGHIGEKLQVYLRLLDFCQEKFSEVYILTRRTYEGNGVFNGGWLYKEGKFTLIKTPLKIDLVYDRTGGVKFPLQGDNLEVVNRRDFKVLCWDKWAAYKKIGQYMPKTFWVGEAKNLAKVLPKIKTNWVVLKPYNGLKGIGIFIGPKEKTNQFDFSKRKYIAQEFIDTSGGIKGVTSGLHDLRVAITNGKAVWTHVRIPPESSFKANVAEGGRLTEINYKEVPDSVKKIVNEIAEKFYKEYDNPSYSIDFGMEKDKPFIFEINDQIGFPKWEMKARDTFLKELVYNFKDKIYGQRKR